MKKGTKVSWTLKGGAEGGSGTTITDEVDGHVQVAIDSHWKNGQTWANEEKYTIWCAVTWLTVVS
jgi:hypothetical protein